MPIWGFGEADSRNSALPKGCFRGKVVYCGESWTVNQRFPNYIVADARMEWKRKSSWKKSQYF